MWTSFLSLFAYSDKYYCLQFFLYNFVHEFQQSGIRFRVFFLGWWIFKIHPTDLKFDEVIFCFFKNYFSQCRRRNISNLFPWYNCFTDVSYRALIVRICMLYIMFYRTVIKYDQPILCFYLSSYYVLLGFFQKPHRWSL